ncbi:MAG: response regulator transcription factor [Candidatus Margulisiibacteriota bacterium]
MTSENIVFILSENPKLNSALSFSSTIQLRFFDNTTSLETALALENLAFQVVLIDLSTLSIDHLTKWAIHLKKIFHHLPIIAIGTCSHAMAIQCLRAGVIGFFPAFDENLIKTCGSLFSSYPQLAFKQLDKHAYKSGSFSGFFEYQEQMEYLSLNRELTQFQHVESNASMSLSLSDQFFKPQKPRVLFVDDLPNIAMSFKWSYSDIYEIFQAENAKQALFELQREPNMDVVILDIEMPGKKGHEIIPDIRKLTPKAMILILTGYENTEIAQIGFERGAEDYLNKSAPPEEIQEKIDELVYNKALKENNGGLPFPKRFALFSQYSQLALERGLPVKPAIFKKFFPHAQIESAADLWPTFLKSPSLEIAVKKLLAYGS